jgi:hypothetical protein
VTRDLFDVSGVRRPRRVRRPGSLDVRIVPVSDQTARVFVILAHTRAFLDVAPRRQRHPQGGWLIPRVDVASIARDLADRGLSVRVTEDTS